MSFHGSRISEQKPVHRKSSASTRSVAPRACPSRPLTSNHRSQASNDSNCPRNRLLNSNVVHPERMRSEQSKSRPPCSNDNCPMTAESKSSITKKVQSKKNAVSNISFKDNFSRVSGDDKVCIVSPVQTKICSDVKETVHKNISMDLENKLPILINEKQDDTVKDEKPNKLENPVYDSHLSSIETNGIPLLSSPSILSTKNVVSHESLLSRESMSQESFTSDNYGSNVPLGWERVLLSLQVQMSPVSSPDSSAPILEEASHFSSKLYSNSHRNIQTTSEIMVLPIITSDQHNIGQLKLTEQTSDTQTGVCLMESNPMKNLLNYKIKEAQESKLSGIIEISEEKENSRIKHPESSRNPSVSQMSCEVDDVVATSNEKCQNLKTSILCHEECSRNYLDDMYVCEQEHKDHHVDNLEVKESTHLSPENVVAELKLNQNDIVKMAYEIIDIVSHIHVSKNSLSNTSENLESDNELQRCITDLSLEHFESSDQSVRTVQYLGKITEFDAEKIIESSDSTENTFTDYKYRKLSSNSDLNDLSEDTEIEMINIVNTFSLPRELPILLYENKKVNKLMKEFTAKLKVSEKDSFSLDDPKNRQSAEILNERIVSETSGSKNSEQDNIDNKQIEHKKEDDEQLNKTDKINLKMQATQGNGINIKEECFNLNHVQTTVFTTEKQELCINDESTTSEVDTEKSLEVHSEAGAEDGDDEATGSTSDAVVEDLTDVQYTSPGEPFSEKVCTCKDTHEKCPLHPEEEDGITLEGSCICEKFQNVCTGDNEPSTADNVNPSKTQTMDDGKAVEASGSKDVSKSASWVPWVRVNGNEDGPRIPDFVPTPTENASTITIPPHVAKNTLDLLVKKDHVSMYGSRISIIPWKPEDTTQDAVPDTISEYHWMPDDLRAFSSTLIYPEIPSDVEQYSPENHPMLYVRQSGSADSTVSGFILQSSTARPNLATSETGKISVNPDAPAEVPGATYGHGFDFPVGGTLFDVLSSAIEKSILPLKSIIDELKMKVDRMETLYMSNMRPDILVGVTSVSTSQGRTCTSDSCDLHSASTCVPPLGIYVLQQRSTPVSENLTPGANFGNTIQGSSQRTNSATLPSLPCSRCEEKLRTTPSAINRTQSDSVRNNARPSFSRMPEERVHDSQLDSQDYKYQMNPRCKCAQNYKTDRAQNNHINESQTSRITGDLEPIYENEKCTKCPKEDMINSSEEFESTSPKCVKCKPPHKTERTYQQNISEEQQLPHQEEGQQYELQLDQQNKQPKPLCQQNIQKDLLEQNTYGQDVPEKTPAVSQEGKGVVLCRECRMSKLNHASQVCEACKTCVPVHPSFDQSIFKPSSFQNLRQNSIHKCCTCPLPMQKTSSDLPWMRIRRCLGCGRCPFSPPGPPPPPPKPALSPIAQMYLDMSRAKHDWSDESNRRKNGEEDVCECPTNACPGLAPEKQGQEETQIGDPADESRKEEPPVVAPPAEEPLVAEPPKEEPPPQDALEEPKAKIECHCQE